MCQSTSAAHPQLSSLLARTLPRSSPTTLLLGSSSRTWANPDTPARPPRPAWARQHGGPSLPGGRPQLNSTESHWFADLVPQWWNQLPTDIRIALYTSSVTDWKLICSDWTWPMKRKIHLFLFVCLLNEALDARFLFD